MTFCKINGWTIPVKDRGAVQQKALFGNVGPAWTGRPNRRERGIPSGWDMNSLFLDAADADTLEALLTGIPFHFPLDSDFWSDGGLGPQGGFGTINFVQDGEQKIGFGYMDLVSGDVIWNPELGDNWTVMVWHGTGSPVDWSHYVVRSDGAKWVDGVRNDLAATAFLTVSNGAVSLSTDKYDDLWIFPFSVSDGFRDQFWGWTFSNGLLFNCPLDRTFLDIYRGKFPTVAGVTFAPGRFGDAANFSGAPGDEIRFSADADFEITASTKTVIAWVKIRSLVGPPDFVLSQNLSASAGWNLQAVASGGSGDYRLHSERRCLIAPASSAESSDLTFGDWVHVAIVFSSATSGRPSLYVNGSLAAVGNAPGSGFLSGSGADFCLGDDSFTATDPIDGLIADCRIYSGGLSAAQVADDYARGLAGRLPGNQPAPQSPYMILDGDCVGWEQTSVLGAVSSEIYQQHGGGAWVNNARPISFHLDEEMAPERKDAIPTPDAGWVLDERLIGESGDLSPAFGTDPAVVSAQHPRIGPFERGQSFEADGTASQWLDISGLVADGLYGAEVATVAAWVYRDATANADQILDVTLSGSNAKLALSITAGDLIQVGARSVPADALQTVSGGTTVGAAAWHLVAAEVNLSAKTGEVWLDGESDGTGSSLVWAGDFFDATGTTGRVFADATGGTKFDGRIASVMIWHRGLSADEHREIYQLGRRGVLR